MTKSAGLGAGGLSRRGALAGLVWREVRELAASSRFRVTSLLTVVLMALAAWIAAARYLDEIGEHQLRASEHASSLRALPLRELLDMPYPIYKPPWKLAALSDGRQRWTPDVYRASLNVYKDPELTSYRGADLEIAGGPLDWAFVIRVILSMAAFALGYDAVCGQRQRTLLRTTLSHPVRPSAVIAAKVVAVWACVASPFVLGAAVSLLILLTYGGIHLSFAEWLKCGLLVAVGLWASAFFAGWAVWASIRARDAARSLAELALLWVTAVIAIPGAGVLLAQVALPLPTDEEILLSRDAVRDEVESTGGPGGLRPPDDAAKDGFTVEKETLAIQNERYWRQEEDVRRRQILDQLAQVELAHGLASVSPMFLVQDLAERLVGSGPRRDRGFVGQAWEFEDRLARRVLEIVDLDSDSPYLVEGAVGLQPIQVRVLPMYVSYCLLAPEDLPDFDFRERSLGEGLRAAAPRAALLSLFTGVLLLLLRGSGKRLTACVS